MPAYPAIALFEFAGAPAGAVAADAMAKAAPLQHFQVGTVQPGHYLVLLGGEVAALEEAIEAGLRTAPTAPRDAIFLPDVDESVAAGLLGKRSKKSHDAVLIADSALMPQLVGATDAAVKNAAVQLLELRLGDELGGRGLVHLGGLLADVHAAEEVLRSRIADPETIATQVLSNLSPEMSAALGNTTRFGGK